jgi:hypothetical protein
MFVMPGDVFTKWIDGRERAIDRNWSDISHRNLNARAEMQNINDMYALEERQHLHPGALASADAKSDLLVRTARQIEANKSTYNYNTNLAALDSIARNHPDIRHAMAGILQPNLGGVIYHSPDHPGRAWWDPYGQFGRMDFATGQYSPPAQDAAQGPSGTGGAGAQLGQSNPWQTLLGSYNENDWSGGFLDQRRRDRPLRSMHDTFYDDPYRR